MFGDLVPSSTVCKFRLGVIFRKGVSAGVLCRSKKYIPDTTFGLETIKDMTTAFERIRIVLKLKDPDDPLIEVVAKKVVSLASRGTRDPKEIERLVIADIKRT